MLVIVCAIAKHEDLYVDEWVTYYLYGLGVDHVHLFDNGDENTLRTLPACYPGQVSVYHLPGPGMQYNAYNTIKSKVDVTADTWCAFIDLDEFIVLKRHQKLAELLGEYADCSALVLNWVLFGDSGHTEYSAVPVTERFTLCQGAVDQHVKSIVKLEKMGVMMIHDATYRSGSAVDTNRKTVVGPFNPQGPTDTAVIHHYFGKSRAEFMLKRARGRAGNSALRTEKDFDAHNFNEVSDFSALLIYADAKRSRDAVRGDASDVTSLAACAGFCAGSACSRKKAQPKGRKETSMHNDAMLIAVTACACVFAVILILAATRLASENNRVYWVKPSTRALDSTCMSSVEKEALPSDIEIPSFGFILLRHVNSRDTNLYWQESFNCIRRLYPYTPVVIIDDNSTPEFIKRSEIPDSLWSGVETVNSEFKGRGELLPYYYFSRYGWFKKACIIHDSVFIQQPIPMTSNPYDFLWEFVIDQEMHSEDNMIDLIDTLKQNEAIKSVLYTPGARGCFGVMAVVSLQYLRALDAKHNLSALLKVVLTRSDRMGLERVMACILQTLDLKRSSVHSLYGNINDYCNWGITFDRYSEMKSQLPVVKIWTGR